jgi:hypothetical protein
MGCWVGVAVKVAVFCHLQEKQTYSFIFIRLYDTSQTPYSKNPNSKNNAETVSMFKIRDNISIFIYPFDSKHKLNMVGPARLTW